MSEEKKILVFAKTVDGHPLSDEQAEALAQDLNTVKSIWEGVYARVDIRALQFLYEFAGEIAKARPGLLQGEVGEYFNRNVALAKEALEDTGMNLDA